MKKNAVEKKYGQPTILTVLPTKLYTPEEVASYLKVAPSTIYNWVKTGKLEGHTLAQGKRKSTVRFDESQILRFMQSWKGGSR